MSESILLSTKKALGISEDYTAFDPDVIMHLNAALAVLNQLGVGPTEGFAIFDESPTWEDLLGDDPRYNSVKTYIFLRVRILFDPPTTSYLISALNDQLREYEWRLSTTREGDEWVHPEDDPVVSTTTSES